MLFPARLLLPSVAVISTATSFKFGFGKGGCAFALRNLTMSTQRSSTANSNDLSKSNMASTCIVASEISATRIQLHEQSRFKIGLGTMDLVADAIHSALDIGYRRIDCAPVYFNEAKIGDALKTVLDAGTVERNELFVVSKLASPFHRQEHVAIGVQKTLTDLRLDYLDLLLLHWPPAFYYVETDPTKRGYDNEDIDDSKSGKNIDPAVSIHETWLAMEDLIEAGLVKDIGVSNFPVSLLHELMTKCRLAPAVNQVELHPYLQQQNLLNYCKNRGVQVQAYSPLGTQGYKKDHEPNLLGDPTLCRIAQNHDVSAAVICIAWALQRGTTVVAKSSSALRQEENWSVLAKSITLSLTEMDEIASLERGYRFFRPEDWWGDFGMAVFN
jgi:diketogulonate reductase-like aldo/keto reductase